MTLPDWVPLNQYLILNPVNWVIVVMMVIIGSIIMCIIGGAIGVTNGKSE